MPSSRHLSGLAAPGTVVETGEHMVDGLLEFDTIHDVQARACAQWGDRDLFGTYDNGEFGWMTYAEFDEKVKLARGVLTDLGIKQGDTVGVISNNRWEWAAVAAAAYSLSAVMVPMYEAQLPSDWSYILNDASCKTLMCANQDIYDRASAECTKSVPSVSSILCFDAPAGEPHSFKTAMEATEGGGGIVAPGAADLANLIYTSGTTGKPKGVELTHANQISNIYGTRQIVENPLDFMRHDDRSLSFLPWAHSYGQTCELWSLMAHGAGMGICRGVPDILEDLQLVKPSLLFSVPTLYKRVYDGVHNMINETNPIRRSLMKNALALGEAKVAAENAGGSLGGFSAIKHNALDGLVLSKIRDRFGGNLRVGFVAGAACPPEIIGFMDNIGIPVCEGYGLTETSPVVAINSPEARKIGSVGRAIGGVEVLAVDPGDNQPLPTGSEGEICVIGPNIMKGYHNKPDATDEVISVLPDGRRMFHTGDLGTVGTDNFVKITGRLKEQYKLENGKYVVPTPVEEAIGMSRFIMQIVLCGANRPYNVCLIVPDVDALKNELKLDGDITVADLQSNPDVLKLMEAEIQSNSKSLKKFEVPQKFHFVNSFTVENQMLTPKMSVRRHVAITTYCDEIGAMYGDSVVTDEERASA
jgi:long-chain acyl-CoA synthetase